MLKKATIILGSAFAIWAFCGALIGIGRQFMDMDTTLVVHAIGAPVGAAFFSWFYFYRYGFTTPLVTAILFVATSLALDYFVVALLIEKSFEMFGSVLGVWIPQLLIFAATFCTGHLMNALTPETIVEG